MTSRAATLLRLLLVVLLCAAAMPQAVASRCTAMAKVLPAQVSDSCEKPCCPPSSKVPAPAGQHRLACLAACVDVAAPQAEDQTGSTIALGEPGRSSLATALLDLPPRSLFRPATTDPPHAAARLTAPLRI